jgi:flagellar biosynthesis anti-sigma factor FlgM
MDIRTGLDGLRSLLGVSQPSAASTQPAKNGASQENDAVSSDVATLSNAGSEVAQAETDGGVRMDKVSSVQTALGAGTYNVPASAVASKLVDAMLARGR